MTVKNKSNPADAMALKQLAVKVFQERHGERHDAVCNKESLIDKAYYAYAMMKRKPYLIDGLKNGSFLLQPSPIDGVSIYVVVKNGKIDSIELTYKKAHVTEIVRCAE